MPSLEPRGSRPDCPRLLNGAIAIGFGANAVDANGIGSWSDNPRRWTNRESVGSGRGGDDVDPLLTVSVERILKIRDDGTVPVANLDDDVDALLVDDDPSRLARSQREAVAMFFSAGELPLDGLAGLEHGNVRRLRGEPSSVMKKRGETESGDRGAGTSKSLCHAIRPERPLTASLYCGRIWKT